jgi:hypothetical protein
VAAASLIAVSGCGAEEAEETADDPVVEEVQEEPREPSPQCERVSDALLQGIASGLTVTGGGSLRNGWAVRSNDFAMVYMVAAEIHGDGMDGVIGVWATNNLDGTGSIFAADGIAREFSEWGPGQVQPTDHGVREARQCVETNR